MKKQFIGLVALACLLPSFAQAAGASIVGVVTSVERHGTPTLQITMKGGQTRVVREDADTQYMKWITHQPWQQDNRATDQSAAVGSCVAVELRAGDGTIAKLVRVNMDGAGTFFDPCKAIR